ncbi:MAG: lamin tail domain-containing protein [Patescibacteria group bacterium]|nr:lamin tail domain-containing protein [Patescibacteria group bacterium]
MRQTRCYGKSESVVSTADQNISRPNSGQTRPICARLSLSELLREGRHDLGLARQQIPLNLILKKFAAVSLACGLIGSFLPAAFQPTVAFYDDIETSSGNAIVAGSLDFSLDSPGFALSEISLEAAATSTVSILDHSSLPFQYNVRSEVTGGDSDFCNALILSASLNNAPQGQEPLSSYVSPDNIFSTTTPTWQIQAGFAAGTPDFLQDKQCGFKIIYTGWQDNLATSTEGFSDIEETSFNLIYRTPLKVKINKVYANPDVAHGINTDNEWIELYNTDSAPVNISNWTISDNSSTDTLASTSPLIIPAGGYAIITDKPSTWDYWEIPGNVLKIALNSPIGNGLNDGGDLLILKDSDGKIMDWMNWGAGTTKYGVTFWNPGVTAPAKGDFLARVPSGTDTDSPADWQGLKAPFATLDYPVGGEVWYAGHTETLRWTAHNPNGSDDELKIDLYYSRDSGATWAIIVTGTPNTGSYDWRIPLFLEDGSYYVPSHISRIKVVATGPENFMVQSEDSSEDFCPPIDYNMLTPQEQELVDWLLQTGTIPASEVIYGGMPQGFSGSSLVDADPANENVLKEEQSTLENIGNNELPATDILETSNATEQAGEPQPAEDLGEGEDELLAPDGNVQPAADFQTGPAKDITMESPESQEQPEQATAKSEAIPIPDQPGAEDQNIPNGPSGNPDAVLPNPEQDPAPEIPVLEPQTAAPEPEAGAPKESSPAETVTPPAPLPESLPPEPAPAADPVAAAEGE